jgi:hypothetical protein
MLAVLLIVKETEVPAQIEVAVLAEIETEGVEAVLLRVMVLPVALAFVTQPNAFDIIVT